MQVQVGYSQASQLQEQAESPGAQRNRSKVFPINGDADPTFKEGAKHFVLDPGSQKIASKDSHSECPSSEQLSLPPTALHPAWLGIRDLAELIQTISYLELCPQAWRKEVGTPSSS